MEGLAFNILEWIVTGALGAVVAFVWYLKAKIDEMKDQMHLLEKRIIEDYAKKAELREAVSDALGPLKDAISDLKQELRHTMRSIDEYRKFGPPE